MVDFQVLIVEFGSHAFTTTHLTVEQWLWCIFFGLFELIWGQIVISIPISEENARDSVSYLKIFFFIYFNEHKLRLIVLKLVLPLSHDATNLAGDLS